MQIGGFGPSLNAALLIGMRTYRESSKAAARAMEHIATGKKINRPSDDPAGAAAADNLARDATDLAARLKTAERSKALLGTADGGFSVLGDLLLELDSLVVGAANRGGTTRQEREGMQTDAESILTAMNVVLDNTSFENTRILREGFSVTTPDGSYSYAGLSLRALGSAVWAPRAAGATEPVLSGEPESAPAAGEPAGAGSEPVASPPKEVTLENLRDVLNLVDGDAETAQGLLKGAIGYVAAMRAEFGTKMKYDLGSRLNVTRSELEGVTKEYSRIVDADYAVEVSALVRAQLLQRVSIASLQSIFASQRESAAGLLTPARAPGAR